MYTIVYCIYICVIYGYISTYDWEIRTKALFAPKREKRYVSSRTYILNHTDAGITW